MSTRATIHFHEATVYTHFDGYPSQQAERMHAMLDDTGKGAFATRFIRANWDAELTNGDHGDTEWRYDVTRHGSLEVFKRSPGGDWQFDSALDIWDFVAVYTEHRIVQVTTPSRGTQRLTLSQAQRDLDRMESLRQTWVENGFAESFNYRALMEDITRYQLAIETETMRSEPA